MNTVADFWTHADKSGGPLACWTWQLKGINGGYGRYKLNGRPWYAHRLSFWLTYGFLPEAVCHRCDNPPCINPHHLRDGTLSDNTSEMWAKGREKVTIKLTIDDAAEARRRYAATPTTVALDEIARDFGVSRRTVYRLVYGPLPRYAQPLIERHAA